jgi:DNA-binding NarL/FixJ family response regulator
MPNQSRRKSSTVRVGIADKSPLVRAGLRHLFENDERFVLVTVLSHPARTAPITGSMNSPTCRHSTGQAVT